MLDELRERRPPPVDNTEVNDRLRRIESLLDSILRDATEDMTPSDSSTDLASLLRGTLGGARVPRPPTILTPQPTRFRAPLPSLDAEWEEFMNAPPALPEQPVQGPPELVPLIRRSSRVPHMGSISPPQFSITSPILRGSSAPPEASIHIDPFTPFRSPGSRLPPVGTLRRRPPGSRPEIPYRFEDIAGGARPDRTGGFFPPRRDVSGAPTGPSDIDFDRRVREQRRGRSGGDGFHDATTRPVRLLFFLFF